MNPEFWRSLDEVIQTSNQSMKLTAGRLLFALANFNTEFRCAVLVGRRRYLVVDP